MGCPRLSFIPVVLAISLAFYASKLNAAQEVLTYPAGIIPESIAVADFDGDGNVDVVVTNYWGVGSVTVLLGNGDSTLQEAKTYYLPGNEEDPSYVAVGDFNKDGKPDLAVAGTLCSGYGCKPGVTVLLGNGDGTFEPVPVSSYAYAAGGYGYGAASVAVGDFNHDSNPDLAVGVTVCTGVCNGVVALLMGNGDGTFYWAGSYDYVGEGLVSVAVGDFNKDGKLDLVAAGDASSNVGILLGNGDGTFQPAVSYATGAHRPGIWGGYSFLVAVGSFNGDGNLDLVVANGCEQSVRQCNGRTSVLLGNGDGSFQEPRLYSSGGWLSTSVAVGDFNADGTLDPNQASL